jgi:hypothetical protein
MIDRISLKRLDGQLEEIEYNNNFNLRNGFNFGFRIKSLNSDYRKLILIFNQLQNIYQIVESARHNLVFSAGNFTKNFCSTFLKTNDIDALETIASGFLSSSILYFNSSFDYLRILIRIAYSTTEELTNTISMDKLRKEIKRLKIDKRDWWIAFFSLMTKPKNNRNEEVEWIKKNLLISGEIKDSFHRLWKSNKELKKKYCANSLKHGVFPYFRRTNYQNIVGAYLQISLELYYGKTKSNQISFGLRKKPLIIDDVQNYLINYNNETVQTVNLIQTDIREFIEK